MGVINDISINPSEEGSTLTIDEDQIVDCCFDVCIKSDVDCTREQIIEHPGFPKRGTEIETNLFMYRVQSFERLGLDANCAMWKAVICASTRRIRVGECRCTGVDIAFEKIGSVFDAAGRPVVNKACEFLENFTVDVPIHRFKLCCNFTKPPQWLITHNGAVNAFGFDIAGFDIGPGQGRLIVTSIPLEPQYDPSTGLPYFEVCYEIHHNPNGWHARLLNVGYMEKKYLDVDNENVSPTADLPADPDNPQPGELFKIERCVSVDSAGQQVTSPQFLDFWGRPKPNVSLLDATLATVDSQSNPPPPLNTPASTLTLTYPGTTFPFIDDDIGSALIVKCSGPALGFSPYCHVTTILQVLPFGDQVVIADQLPFDPQLSTAVTCEVKAPGVCLCTYQRYPIVDFSGIPICSAANTDSDLDGIPDAIECENGTSPWLPDSDFDGVPDGTDNFPLDPGLS